MVGGDVVKMKFSIDLSDEEVEKLFTLVGYSEPELDDELEISDAIKELIEEY